jgi:putative transposase
MTVAKAEEAGRRLVLVTPRNTSKMCSSCGELVQKTLSEPIHACPACGLVLGRDHNAALNILHGSLQTLRL